jgi:hypothetical protein
MSLRFSSASLPSVGLFGLIATPDGRYDGAWLTGIGGGENSRGLAGVIAPHDQIAPMIEGYLPRSLFALRE